MSAEEMRVELERFVNVGLQEGWHGWPRRAEAGQGSRFRGRWHATTEGAARETGDDSVSFGGPHGAFGTLRRFDRERRMIRVGTPFALSQS